MRMLSTSIAAVAFVSVVGVTPSLAQAAPGQFQFAQPVLPQGARATTPPPPRSTGPELRGISVVLLEGDLAAGGGTAGIPAAAAKALADMKDFLPYKGYRVLDTQWTLGTGRIAVRLRGTAGHDYDLELTSAFADPATRARLLQLVDKGLASPSTAAQAPSGVSISEFRLREATATPSQGPMTPQGQRSATAQASRSSEGVAEVNGRVVNRYFDAAASPSLIETAFRMDVGETVVVGTSRLQGDKALIVLLTAVAK